MPTSTTRPRGRTMARASVMEAALPTQSNTTSAPSVSRPASTSDPAWRRTARASWSGGTTWSAPSEAASSRWRACLAPTTTVHGGGRADQVVEGGDGGEAEGAGTDHGDDVAGGDAGRQGGVDGAGRRLDHDGVLVAQRVGHGVELAGVGHQRCRRPAAAGVGAEPGLQPGLEGAEGHVAAQAGVARPALGAERVDVARARSRAPAR